MLNEKAIDKFQKLHESHFGKDIGREEAIEKAVQLIRIMQLTYKSITKKEYEDLQKRREKDKEANNNLIEESNGKSIPP